MSDSNEQRIVASIIACCCSLSISGANYIIYKYIKQYCTKSKKTKSKPSRRKHHEILKFVNTIILWIAITDLIDYSSEILGASALLLGYWDGGKNWLCLVQGIGTHIGSVSSIAYTVASSWMLHQIIRLPQSKFETNIQNNLKKINYLMHATIWVITFICVAPPVILDLYGPAQGHCWIINEGIGIPFRWILFYIPAWIGTFYMIYVYFLLLRFEANSSDENLTASLIIKNIRYFPLILVICYIPATSKRVYDLTGDKDKSVEFIFQCAMYGGLMLVGFFDGILFGYLLFSGVQHTQLDDEGKKDDESPLNTSMENKSIDKESSEGQINDYKYDHISSNEQKMTMGDDSGNFGDIDISNTPKNGRAVESKANYRNIKIVNASENRSSQKTSSTSDGVEYPHSHIPSHQNDCIKVV